MKFTNYPLTRRDNLVVQEISGEIMIYDLDKNKAFCLNETSAVVWQLCDGNHSITEISKIISKRFGSIINEDLVWFAVEQLKKEKLIENENELAIPFLGMNRREIIKKVGISSMIALPIVASLVAPSAINAASLVCITTPGMNCTCQFPSSPSRMTGICGAPGVGGVENVTNCNAPTANCNCNITNISNPNCNNINTNCMGACA